MDMGPALVLSITAFLAIDAYFDIRKLRKEQKNLKENQKFFLDKIARLTTDIECLQASYVDLSVDTAAPQPKTENVSSVKPNVLSRSARRRIARRKQRQELKQSAMLNNDTVNPNQE